jgi:hypothetical protein
LLATAECLLRQLGAKRGRWDDESGLASRSGESCEKHAQAALEE